MSRRLAALADRVRRLANTLASLRERVRAAVAAELGTAVGDAVRDLVQALARGAAADWPEPTRPVARDWADDPWDDDPDPGSPGPWPEDGDLAHAANLTPPVTRLAEAVAAAAAVARWWAARPVLSPWAAATLTLLAGAAAWCGGPLAHAALAALAATADLLAVGRSDPTPIP